MVSERNVRILSMAEVPRPGQREELGSQGLHLRLTVAEIVSIE